MQMLRLSSDTYFCEHEDNAVFLNLSRNRYYAVDGETVRQLRHWVYGWPQAHESGDSTGQNSASTDRSTITDLLSHGILTASREGGKSALPIAIPSCIDSFPIWRDDPTTCPRMRDLNAFLSSVATVWVTLRLFGLKRAIHRMARLEAGSVPQPPSPEAMADVKNLTARFFRIRSWFYTARDACLLDSLIFWDFLRRNGLMSTLVIGVKMKPFGAHAWIQFRDLILTDTPESVSRYKPLLVQGHGTI